MKDNIKDIIIHLEKERMYYEPYKYLRKYIKNTKDIYEERALLKSISFNEKSIDYLVGIIVDEIKNKKRFKKFECLKIIKRIIKNRLNNVLFNTDLVDNLFYLYQNYIFTDNIEIQWAVSVYIKDQILSNEQIQWLIDNWEESDHLVNRLLRYPVRHQLITDWATLVYKQDIISDRSAEIIGCLIDDDIPDFITEDNDILMRAIFYSRCSKIRKEELILKYMDYNNYSSAIKIANWLNLNSISKELLRYYKNLYI